MKKIIFAGAVLSLAFSLFTSCNNELDLSNMTLVPSLSDEFDGEELDTDKWWVYTGSVYNNEKQKYLNDGSTVEVSDGTLKLKAYLSESKWYSGKIQASSHEKEDGSTGGMPFKYGYVEARLKMPVDKGVWPAFWLMPDKSEYGAWPFSGELDIMEFSPSTKGTTAYATYHKATNAAGGHDYHSLGSKNISSANTKWHTYGLYWTEKTLEAYYDGESLGTVFKKKGKSFAQWPYDKEFYVILNLAMGGDLGGTIDSSLTEAVYEVDYVRVYQ